MCSSDLVSVRPDVTLEVVLRYLRMRGDLPPRTDSLFVVDRDDRYLGTIGLTRIITGDPDDAVGDSLDTDAPRIEPDTAAHEVAQLFQDRDLVSAAVVGREGKLLGRITVDDVVDVIREEAEHSVLSMAGLQDDEDLFAAIVPSAQRRMLWLGINLVTAFLAAYQAQAFRGLPQAAQAAALAEHLSSRLHGLLHDALAGQQAYKAKYPTDKPPMIDGDIFSSLFEGATSGTVDTVEETGDTAAVRVKYVYSDPSTGKVIQQWPDRFLLVRAGGSWLIDDVEYLGGWDFAPKGKLSAGLAETAALRD